MRLIITRHGETLENIDGIMQGHMHGTLSSLGIEQAEKLAGRLKYERIDFIYSSDLARAADTAKAISKHHPECKLELTRDLRERDLGEHTGRKKSDFMSKDKSIVLLDPKNGESLAHMHERARNFLNTVFARHRSGTVLLVCHNGIGKSLIAVLQGERAEYIPKIGNLGNTSVSVFEIEGGKVQRTQAFNCTKHL